MGIDPRITATLGTILVLAVLLPPSAEAGTGDGSVLSITKIQDNGPDTARFNIVIMGDGFTAAEMATYETRAQQVVDAFNAEVTYGACGGAVNFYRVNVESDESGSDKPAPCYSPAVA
ncbi:MAG TPA: M64 family metallopeptidase, partial [Thermoanaerobaculia bacterium]|nr:M64 family metallopeptidase [Thermoanaerobaculia bacterium]